MTSGRRTKAQRQQPARKRPSGRKAVAEARRRRLRLWWAAGVTIVLVGVGVGLAASESGAGAKVPRLHLASLGSLGHLVSPGPPGPAGPEGVPIPNAPLLAGTSADASGQTVKGIQCNTTEQVRFHVHTHLTIFVDGHARQIPYGIGIVPPRQVQHTPEGPFVTAGTCFYWLHTHTTDGIIHIESPVQRTYTLGDFFVIWGQPLGPDQVGPVGGKVTAFYDGKVYLGDPADIPIGDHVQVQLDVGRPLAAPETIRFPPGL